jgi:hypothetical protein
MIVGNVATEGVAVRDKIFIQMDGICQLMIQEIGGTLSMDTTEKICWVLSVLMKDEPIPSSVIVTLLSLFNLFFSLKMFSKSAKLFKGPLIYSIHKELLKWKRFNYIY